MATVRQRQPLTPDVQTLPLMLACALAGIGCVGLGGCAAGTPDAAPPALTTSARTDTATRPAATGRTSATNTTSLTGSARDLLTADLTRTTTASLTDSGLAEPRLLHDFNHMTFERRLAPY